jgi:hypothetical protein
MNYAEQRRNVAIAAMSDLDLLRVVTRPHAEDVSEGEFNAFVDMLAWVEGGAALSKKQRAWAEEAARRIVPLKAEDVPRGREVVVPDVLRHLPKKPPPRSG